MSKEYVKASVKASTQWKSIVTISVYTLLTLFSLVMAIYDIAMKRVFFGVLFLIAAAIFVVLLLIRGNSVFGTNIKVKVDLLIMKSWATDFLPYDVNGGILADLIPAKTKVTEVPVEEITQVFIGTKDFVKRNATVAGKKLLKALFPYEHSSSRAKKNLLSAIDLFYVETETDCAFMCVHDYDTQKMMNILKAMREINPAIRIRVNSIAYKKHFMNMQNAED